MKKIILNILVVLLFGANSFAATDGLDGAFLTNNDSFGVENIYSDYRNRISEKDIAELEDFLRQRDSELVRSMQNQSWEIKYNAYKNRISEIAFNEFKTAFINRLKAKGDETGRAVKSKSFTINDGCVLITQYWLDNGVLDSADCSWMQPNLDERRWVDWIKQHVCSYPDGYEEHSVSVQQSTDKCRNRGIDDVYNIYTDDDDKNENIRQEYDVLLIKHDAPGNGINISLDVSGRGYEYTDYHAWRNQEVKDIRAGMFIYDGKGISMDKSKKWESQKLPGWTERGLQSNYGVSFGEK